MIEKQCLQCQKEFKAYQSEIKKGGGKYCSRACYLKNLKTKKPHNFQNNYINCLTCGKKFHVPLNKIKEGKGKYCCLKCYRKAHSSTTTRICKGCGKQFSFPKWQNQTCCSLSCNAKWKKIKNKKKNYVKKECLQCGKKMDVLVTRERDGRGKFCCKKCYNQWLSELYEHYETSLNRIRGLRIYKSWREDILKKDHLCCVKCESKKQLEVDHIKPFIEIIVENNIRSTKEARQCKELWSLDNGQTLCRKCHTKKSKKQRQKVVDLSFILKTL